jgi:Fic-DOC domain mobile mystery protein B
MGLELTYLPGQTPLDEDEKEGLMIKTINTRGELDEAEQLNIEEAIEWTLRKRFNVYDIIDEVFVKELHKRMYREVWRWAGEFRKKNKNIGADKYQIPMTLRQLIDDCKLWIHDKVFEPDEIAIRFKHRLVSIHCFPNGNGRHSRLMADVMASNIFGQKVFSWSTGNLVQDGEIRAKYLEALRVADKCEYKLLLAFARS